MKNSNRKWMSRCSPLSFGLPDHVFCSFSQNEIALLFQPGPGDVIVTVFELLET